MTYKNTQVYVVMRITTNPDTGDSDYHPVAVFKDLQTAEGNAEGYNLSMQEQSIEGLHFYVSVTMMYE